MLSIILWISLSLSLPVPLKMAVTVPMKPRILIDATFDPAERDFPSYNGFLVLKVFRNSEHYETYSVWDVPSRRSRGYPRNSIIRHLPPRQSLSCYISIRFPTGINAPMITDLVLYLKPLDCVKIANWPQLLLCKSGFSDGKIIV